MSEPDLLHRVDARIRSILSYGTLIGRNLGGGSSDPLERDLNSSLIGYPRNHNYRISSGRILPSFRLHERLRTVTALYPEPLESFLDVGCCRGFFVIEAARRPHCRLSVGIDVYEPHISIAEQVRERLDVGTARFHLATLDDVSARPEAYGGPFQTVLLIGTYHYLFWGSQLSPKAYQSHDAVLARLSRICAGRLIFSARLEVERLPRFLREKAKASGRDVVYRRSRFLETAEEYFDVRQAGYLGKDPLFLMAKANA